MTDLVPEHREYPHCGDTETHGLHLVHDHGQESSGPWWCPGTSIDVPEAIEVRLLRAGIQAVATGALVRGEHDTVRALLDVLDGRMLPDDDEAEVRAWDAPLPGKCS